MNNRTSWLVMVGMVLLATSSCDKLRPGFCETSNDCPAGQTCDLSTLKCNILISPNDGSPGDGGVDTQMQDVANPPRDASGCVNNEGCTNEGNRACNVSTGQCVQCVTNVQCAGEAAPRCKENKCGGCEADADCGGRADGKGVCDLTTGACVACVKNTDCGGATPVCDAASKKCVQCKQSSQCAAETPICGSENKCGKCLTNVDCVGLGKADQQWCKPDTGQCVQCLDSEACSGTTPFCGMNKCASCAGDDAKCVGGKAEPGVCMGDGHCTAQAESIYVKYAAMCDVTPAGGDGTLAAPFCTVNAGAKGKLAANRSVVVIRGPVDKWSLDAPSGLRITVAGQQAAEVIGGTGGIITIGAGEVEMRKVTITGGGSSDGIRVLGTGTKLTMLDSTARKNGGAGITAAPGTTLIVKGCAVNDNAGGGISLDGAAFEISNTRITGNGPGQNGATTWGGVLVLNPPPNGSRKIDSTSITTNKVVGVACTGAVAASGVLVSGNGAVEIATACGFTSCGAAGPMCGAQ